MQRIVYTGHERTEKLNRDSVILSSAGSHHHPDAEAHGKSYAIRVLLEAEAPGKLLAVGEDPTSRERGVTYCSFLLSTVQKDGGHTKASNPRNLGDSVYTQCPI